VKPDEETALVDSEKTPAGKQLHAETGHRLYWKRKEATMTLLIHK